MLDIKTAGTLIVGAGIGIGVTCALANPAGFAALVTATTIKVAATILFTTIGSLIGGCIGGTLGLKLGQEAANKNRGGGALEIPFFTIVKGLSGAAIGGGVTFAATMLFI